MHSTPKKIDPEIHEGLRRGIRTNSSNKKFEILVTKFVDSFDSRCGEEGSPAVHRKLARLQNMVARDGVEPRRQPFQSVAFPHFQ
jgi:hypothetical protein